MGRRTILILILAALVLPFGPMPARAATPAQINQAIQDGLAWLATQQNATSGHFGSGYLLANTATAVLAFENEGHFPGGGTAYSSHVEKGLNYVFNWCRVQGLNNQTVGYAGRNDNPDTNGNGQGIYFNQSSYMYETGLVMQAIVASNTPNRMVGAGNCAGRTYRRVMEDAVDFLAWAQVDGYTGRGGWRYSYYNNSAGYGDNSVAQWPVLGLVAAEQWGITAPAFVKSEMGHWVTYIQNANGGSGYDGPSNMVNISKTGGLLVEFYYLGDASTTSRAQRALSYVNSQWTGTPSGWNGNKGHPYAMFSVFKGLELMQVTTIPNAPASPDSPAGDWWGDYSHYLVTNQVHPVSGQGFWNGYYYWDSLLATSWYIVILQATVFPVSVDVDVPGAACDQTGYEVDVTYSVERFTADGTLTVYRDGEVYDTIALDDFIGSATATYNVAPEIAGDHAWRAVLAVTGGGISTSAEDTDTGTVYETPRVAGIPDQVAPFTSFDLDDFQTCECADVEWAALDVPTDWTVDIDADNVATVTAPEGAADPAEITFQATFHWDGIDCIGSDSAVFSPNRPPVAHPGKVYPDEKYYVDEGDSVMVDGSLSYDPDGDELTVYEWDLDDDTVFETSGETATFSAAGMDGPSEIYIHIRVCDEHGACSIGTAEVEIENVAPSIDGIDAPVAPVNIDAQPVTVSVTFSDPGVPDTHDMTWAWGDGGSTTATGVTSPVSAQHSYATPGVYEVTCTVTDDDGASDSATYQYIVIYDPDGGFVTGGGWILSPAGAYPADPDLTGRANFGFVSKYKRGGGPPEGNTQFQFQAGGLNFHSSSYEWLVIAGARAKYKGTGTINRSGTYRFMLTAIDGDVQGGGGVDRFRIKIWDPEDDTVIYDNQMGSPDNSDDTTELDGGAVTIHR